MHLRFYPLLAKLVGDSPYRNASPDNNDKWCFSGAPSLSSAVTGSTASVYGEHFLDRHDSSPILTCHGLQPDLVSQYVTHDARCLLG